MRYFKMRTISPKYDNYISFLSSIVISLHYYELLPHPERLSKIKNYFKSYELAGNITLSFEYCNRNVSLTVHDKKCEIIYNPINKSDQKACIVKINNNRYHALKPKMTKEMKLKKLLTQFTHKELPNIILSKITN